MISGIFSITELSNLTNKSRPTIYKYISCYEEGNYDDIPFSFIQLFNLMNKPNVKRKEITEYCEINFQSTDSDVIVNEIITLIKNNKSKINLEKLKKHIEEEVSNG